MSPNGPSWKFFIDENLPYPLATHLQRLARPHRFTSAQDESLIGVADVQLLGDLAERNYDAIVTGDFRQLEDPGERAALREAGLHWIGIPIPSKLHGGAVLRYQLATALAGLEYVLNDWQDQPTAYRLKAPPRGTDGKERL